ncbi:hypothetical protein D3C81_1683520 [compost metagenome]
MVGVLWQGADSFRISLHEVEKFDGKGVQQLTLTVDSVNAPGLEARGNPLKLVNSFQAMSGDSLVEVTTREERFGREVGQAFHAGKLKGREVSRFIDQHLVEELVRNLG